MTMKLKGKNVIITGGSGKLGRLIALSFAKAGANVVIYYNRQRIENVKIKAIKVDIRKVTQIRSAVKKAAKFLGGIDILINAAGIFPESSITSTKENDWNEIMDVNLKGAFFFSKEAAPFLKRSGGRIISIADTYGASPSAKFLAYGIAKAGIIAMTKGLAKALAPDVLVNCVCPGVLDNPPIPPLEKGGEGGFDKRAINSTFLKRAVMVKDVVDAILFLARNDSMTGQMIFVDGGRHV